MTDYSELVKALRCCIPNPPEKCVGCTYNIGNNECAVRRMMLDAAAAIEDMAKHITEMHERVTVLQIARGELERENEKLKDDLEEQKQIAKHYEQSAKDWWKEAKEYYTIASAKDITAEESEELIRQFKKIPCGLIEPLEPKRGVWIKHPEVKNIYGGVYIECPFCGEKYVVQNVSDEKFCRNCGADMRAKMEAQE